VVSKKKYAVLVLQPHQAVVIMRVVEQLTSGSGLEARKKGRQAQLYGVAGSLPDKSIVERMVVAYLDTLYLA